MEPSLVERFAEGAREFKGELAFVRGRVDVLTSKVDVLIATADDARMIQATAHQRMRDALAHQDAARIAFHLETRKSIEKLHDRITGMIWWLVGAQGSLIMAGIGLWFASVKH